MKQYTLESVAESLNATNDDVLALIRQTIARLRQRTYYHFLIGGVGSNPQEAGARPGRTVLLFRTPDDAMAFASQVGVSQLPRVRPVTADALVLRLLADEALGQLIFLDESIDQIPANLTHKRLPELPGAVPISRSSLLDYFA